MHPTALRRFSILTVPISIVIPVKDDALLLERCLSSIVSQTVRPLEVIVVDNGSTDDSAIVAEQFYARVLHVAAPGIAAASSAGYDAARGEVIARCDADSVLPSDWVQRIAVSFASAPELDGLTGPGRFYGVSAVTRGFGAVLYMWMYFATMRLALGHPPLFGSNLALRSAVWNEIRDEVHRHDLGMHDDVDLSVHVGPVRRIRYDRRLVVGISGRPLTDRGGMPLRVRRGFHSLTAHWPHELPPLRYVRRWRRGKH